MNIDLHSVHTSLETPKLIAERYGRSTKYYVPYGIVENDGAYDFKYVLINPNDYNYGGVVDAIISTKYDSKDVIAILANYVGDPTNEKYKSEFDELQEWRLYAKTESKKHFGI